MGRLNSNIILIWTQHRLNASGGLKGKLPCFTPTLSSDILTDFQDTFAGKLSSIPCTISKKVIRTINFKYSAFSLTISTLPYELALR